MNGKEFKYIAGTIGLIFNVIVIVLGCIFVLSNLDLLVENPTYTVAVVIFYYLITKGAEDIE